MKYGLVTAVLALFTAMSCYAASFNCNRALSEVEEIICDHDPDLEDLDEVLARTFRLLLNISPNQNNLRTEQKRWLATKRNICKDSACIGRVYEARIAELEQAWADRTRALAKLQLKTKRDTKRPFEGEWRYCGLWRGYETCSSYVLLQAGEKICGEWEYWATYRTYSGQLQAAAINSSQAELKLICGTPGSETQTECKDSYVPDGGWEATKGKLFICAGRLFDAPADSCSNLRGQGGLYYWPLSDEKRKELSTQSWVKDCQQ